MGPLKKIKSVASISGVVKHNGECAYPVSLILILCNTKMAVYALFDKLKRIPEGLIRRISFFPSPLIHAQLGGLERY